MRDATASTLVIDTVDVPGTGALIGMCACPGGRRAQALDFDPGLDLERDLEAIRRFGAKTLVTLMEERELDMLGVHTLPLQVRRMGIEWRHMPIVDMSVPTAVFEARWEETGALLRDTLLRGEHIVLHCWAGLGRTGTIAAKLLVEFGLEPEAATLRVRSARAGAIQSRAQERYVKKLKPALPTPPGRA
jgi:protein-tyrosine phosphatase